MNLFIRKCFTAAIILTSLPACSGGTSIKEARDEIDKYEAMRLQTGQDHSHVEYCENDIVRLTISSRGELATRKIHVPRQSVVHFKNRDELNTYPLGVRVAVNCLSSEVQRDCKEKSEIIGLNVSLPDSAQRHMGSALEHDMVAAGFNSFGLFELSIKERFRSDDNINRDDLAYVNFAPSELSNIRRMPSLYIRYNSNKFARKDLKRCSWSLFVNQGIRTSRTSDCSDLSEWQTYLSDFETLSGKISWNGEFAKSCENLFFSK